MYTWMYKGKKKTLKEIVEEISVGRHGRRVQTQMVTVCIYSQGRPSDAEEIV